jgi:hypothetical protein
MLRYLVYLLDSDGERGNSSELGARDDAHAIDQAEYMQSPFACDLWERSRFVAWLPAYRKCMGE